LGARRDHNAFSIAEAADGSIGCFVYQRSNAAPFIKYCQDDTVVITTNKYNYTMNNQVVHRMLGIPTDGRQGRMNLTINGLKYALKGNESIKLKRSKETGTWRVLTTQEHYDWRINRKGANNVRARYKPFIDYLKSFVSLRTEEGVVFINVSEYAEQFPERCETVDNSGRVYRLAFMTKDQIINKWKHSAIKYNGDPVGQSQYSLSYYIRANSYMIRHGNTTTDTDKAITLPSKDELLNKSKNNKTYTENTGNYLFMLLSQDPTKWYKAALLACTDNRTQSRANVPLNVVVADPSEPLKFIDEFLLKVHSDETLTKVKLKEGQVPSSKYASWVNEEGTN
jgi:hypothetical protein